MFPDESTPIPNGPVSVIPTVVDVPSGVIFDTLLVERLAV
jgi:hypothetical protein